MLLSKTDYWFNIINNNPSGGNYMATMVRKRHYWWRYLLFTFLGIFIGIGSVAVGVVAAGFTIRGNDIEKWTGQDIFTPEYQDKNIIDLITTIAMNEGNDLDTLGGIAKISPLVDTVVDNINDMFQKNIGRKL